MQVTIASSTREGSKKATAATGGGGEGGTRPAKVTSPTPCKPPAELRVLPAVRAPVKGGEHPVSASSKTSNSHAAEGWLEEARVEAGISKPYLELSVAQQEQLQQRALYLCQQRDKLQALKKEQQRPKQQPAISEEPPATPTPTTPEASRQMNGGCGSVHDERLCAQPQPQPQPAHPSTVGGHKQKEISVEERKKLQKRKHLAEKLKEEVIKK